MLNRSIREAIGAGNAYMLVSQAIGEFFPPCADSEESLLERAHQVFGTALHGRAEIHEVYGYGPGVIMSECVREVVIPSGAANDDPM